MAKTKFPWVNLRKKTEPELPLQPPIWVGTHSNGEYFHQETKREALMKKEIFKRADERARKVGMDRRSFLASSAGVFTTLAVFNEMGCSSTSDGAPAKEAVEGGKGNLFNFGDGPYVAPPEAQCDPGAELNLAPDDYFIFDVQTHSFDDGEWRTRNIVYPIFLGIIASCKDETDKLNCMNQKHYGELMFVNSQTTMSVITSWPAATCFPERDLLKNAAVACGLPLSNEAMKQLRDSLNELAKSQRVINQVQVMPNDMIEHQIEGMYAAMEDPTWRCGSWKAYPAWRSDTYLNKDGQAMGYFMTDPIGRAFIEAGLKLGVPNFAIHKGLPIPGFDVEHNKPTDIGPIAMDYPDANFVIYHSGIHAGTGGNVTAALAPTPTENVPYDPTDPNPLGVNMLIRSLIDAGLIDDPDSPGTKTAKHKLNVFAEMGSAWSNVMGDPVQAQHYIGKLLKYLGPDNIVWGTDCILLGSPQPQIETFKNFTITAEYQDKYGYPELTVDMKRKIFGLNAAKIYHVDAAAKRCVLTQDQFAMNARELDETIGPRRWAVQGPLGPRTPEEYFAHARAARAKRVPG